MASMLPDFIMRSVRSRSASDICILPLGWLCTSIMRIADLYMAIRNTSAGFTSTRLVAPKLTSSINNILLALLRPIPQKCSWFLRILFSRNSISRIMVNISVELSTAIFCVDDRRTFMVQDKNLGVRSKESGVRRVGKSGSPEVRKTESREEHTCVLGAAHC